MSEKYVLAVMDKDGVLPELLQWFESVTVAITEQDRVKDRMSYVFSVVTCKDPESVEVKAKARIGLPDIMALESVPFIECHIEKMKCNAYKLAPCPKCPYKNKTITCDTTATVSKRRSKK